jgi:hypothetical protein
MTITKTLAVPVAALVLFTGCATVPSGPNVVALPGQGKPFEVFRADDYACRTFAAQQTGEPATDTAARNVAGGAILGTLLGAAAGAALGAIGGNAGIGAAAGAGVGLLGGSAVGAGNAGAAYGTMQQRYDAAYLQCMYAKGHQVPVARGSVPSSYASPRVAPPPPPPPPPPPAGTPPAPPAGSAPSTPPAAMLPPNIPPPPPGTPPPPPPGVIR